MLRSGQRWKTLLLLTIFASGCLLGCLGVRTVYVKPGQPVRLRETIRSAKVWVAGSDGKWLESVMDLPEGWYALSDDKP